MITDHPELSKLAEELTTLIDSVAASFGTESNRTVDGELDCDPTHPGHLVCWQYGVHLNGSTGAQRCLVEVVLPSLERTGWLARDRSNALELIAQFSREGADVNVHVARAGGGVAIVGSTRCLETPTP
ncbi:hypothetical protein [Amycolatopsis sp. H20-H5]|uniref:hypothetical protein n=1 Tax=Amycolatopsis sp. H20-H5 TaxID=3046309 RepID=UPI002DB9DFE0|nr:hypothetical protein [Amycolatopsis sp. H20-H5]MEC3978342.1 hypothetical protein [Amycolatopsis sp. H20-H5]